jgi:hypothetical protein
MATILRAAPAVAVASAISANFMVEKHTRAQPLIDYGFD